MREGREGGKKAGKERGSEGEREGREGGREGGRDGGRAGLRREGGRLDEEVMNREKVIIIIKFLSHWYRHALGLQSLLLIEAEELPNRDKSTFV